MWFVLFVVSEVGSGLFVVVWCVLFVVRLFILFVDWFVAVCVCCLFN